eukprot:2701711-Pyramimonas_sp.AAC.1
MRRHEDRAPTSVRELQKVECAGGAPTLMPVHVQVDVSRFVDAMQYFRCPTVMGARQSSTMGRASELRFPHGRFGQDDAKPWYYSSSIRPLGRSAR